jgi:hypothetical protein
MYQFQKNASDISVFSYCYIVKKELSKNNPDNSPGWRIIRIILLETSKLGSLGASTSKVYGQKDTANISFHLQ